MYEYVIWRFLLPLDKKKDLEVEIHAANAKFRELEFVHDSEKKEGEKVCICGLYHSQLGPIYPSSHPTKANLAPDYEVISLMCLNRALKPLYHIGLRNCTIKRSLESLTAFIKENEIRDKDLIGKRNKPSARLACQSVFGSNLGLFPFLTSHVLLKKQGRNLGVRDFEIL